MQPAMSIKDFYSGSTVLVTGGTGYLGKPLIEKLLRSCKDIKCIYVLLRSKKGFGCEERLERLKSNQIFDRLRVENPDALDKLLYVNGDITADNLGLSPLDEDLIKNSVNIVFHSAATVAYNTPIKVALNTNTIGTKRVLDLCRDAKHLQKLVYVSTAYSNPTKEFVEEKVYKSLRSMDMDFYIKCVDNLPPEVALNVFHQMHGFFPNTYTLTKFMAEQLVEDYRNRFGISALIVRPSIIGVASQEPFPGWADSYGGMNGMTVELGRGTVSSFPVKPSAIIDVMPLDMVCNQLIVAAWFDTAQPSIDIRVVNCTSSDRNPLNYRDLLNLIVKHSRVYPSKYTIMYPNMYMPNHRIAHQVLQNVHASVPAYLTDVGLRLMGKRPMAVRTLNAANENLDDISFVIRKTFSFANQSVIDMLQAVVAHCEDSAEFNFDCRSIDWDEYIKTCVRGLQKYKLNCDEASLPSARRALKGQYAAWCLYYGCVNTLTGYALFKLISKL